MKVSKSNITMLIGAAIIVSFSSCAGKDRSGATGWDYNDKDNGGYEKRANVEQETGPGLVLIEGGTFTMGRVEDDLKFSWDNIPRRVTVSSFYMDETEVTNQYWIDYMHWLGQVYGDTYPEIVNKALPDTLVWREKLEYNEPYVDYYLRHPSYQDYPVVGVNWLQSNDFCAWRSDRVNEYILVREGLLNFSAASQVDDDHFTTESYLAGQYEGDKAADGVPNLNPKAGSEYRNVRMEDGILLPKYRLPTEAEWEYAALGLIGNSYQELISDRKTYPWNGHFVRNGDNDDTYFGQFNANFVRGAGDYMGVAGALNDGYDITGPVYAFSPNDYGLYCMAGNVSEWVMDVYRPLSPEDKSEFRSFRGNVFETKVLTSEGSLADKYDYLVYDIAGVTDYLKKYRKASAGKISDDDLNLLDNIDTKMEEARGLEETNKPAEAQEKMQEIMDLITGSDAYVAPDLRDGIADFIDETPGEIRYREVTAAENIDRRNYRISNNMDYKDGDFESSIKYFNSEYEGREDRMYDWGKTTLVNNRARVIKGGSWRDRIYYTIPGTRRYLDERQSSATIGFRCAMTRVGGPVASDPR